MQEKYGNSFLDDLSEVFYSPEYNIFGKESMNCAIESTLFNHPKEKIIERVGEEMWNTCINYIKNFENEPEKYLEFFSEIEDDYDIPNNKTDFLKKINDEDNKNFYISARIRKKFFGDYVNKSHKTIYDFFDKFDLTLRGKMKKSLDYVFNNYPDNEAVKVLDEDLFYFYINEKSDLKNLKFDNFYIHAERKIKGFRTLNKEGKDGKILERILKEIGFQEKLLSERVYSFFEPRHYHEYIDKKLKEDAVSSYDSYQDIDDDEED